MLTLSKVSAAIAAKYPNVYLVQGDGYFYISSDDSRTLLDLSSLYSVGVYVYRINHLTLDQWVAAIDELFKNSY